MQRCQGCDPTSGGNTAAKSLKMKPSLSWKMKLRIVLSGYLCGRPCFAQSWNGPCLLLKILVPFRMFCLPDPTCWLIFGLLPIDQYCPIIIFLPAVFRLQNRWLPQAPLFSSKSRKAWGLRQGGGQCRWRADPMSGLPLWPPGPVQRV